jgi:hypothetical protein
MAVAGSSGDLLPLIIAGISCWNPQLVHESSRWVAHTDCEVDIITISRFHRTAKCVWREPVYRIFD